VAAEVSETILSPKIEKANGLLGLNFSKIVSHVNEISVEKIQLQASDILPMVRHEATGEMRVGPPQNRLTEAGFKPP
jgi:hypothetical protein